MHESYDFQVRGVLGSGKRDVHEIEILVRNLTWTKEGLEYEGSDKHRRALLEGTGLNEESKAVKCSRDTRGDLSRRGHGGAGRVGDEEIQKFGGDVELHELRLSDVQKSRERSL